MRKSTMLAIVGVFLSLCTVMAAGIGAAWLSEEIRSVGLVVLPAAIVASLLVLYFDWRQRFVRRVATDPAGENGHVEEVI